jgi:DNA-binding Xre family transcriptional regulator
LKGRGKMILNKQKVEIAMANECMNPYDLCKKAEMTYQTYQRIVSKQGNCKPATIGKIAKALNVKVEDLVDA